MPEKIPLAIVGCGGMGRRHLYGLAELQDAELSLFKLVPDFYFDDAIATLFSGDRSYEYSGPLPETDRKLIAVAYHKLGSCSREGHRPEVGSYEGAHAVGRSCSLMESQVVGQALSVDAICDDSLNAYQAEINNYLYI